MKPRFLVALVLGAVVLVGAGCSGYSGTRANQVAQWANGASYDSLAAQLRADLTNLVAGERLGNLKALRTACAGFAQDSASLEGELPAPDPTLSNELADETTDFYTAGSDCYDAGSYHDRAYQSFLAKLKAGEALFSKVTERLLSFGVK